MTTTLITFIEKNMNPNTVEYTVQLAVLASLVDGQASDQELIASINISGNFLQ
ncbi:MAG: hypothetical protein F6K39_34650 [Okeania sp. SIO3B3]|nr:hypothetical protein [Okeania sp. SIO3B3]